MKIGIVVDLEVALSADDERPVVRQVVPLPGELQPQRHDLLPLGHLRARAELRRIPISHVTTPRATSCHARTRAVVEGDYRISGIRSVRTRIGLRLAA